MLFRILGPLEVHAREGWLGIGAPKWRALLGALLLRPGQVVPTERLVSELWDDDAPPGARKLTSGYVLRLRRLIDDRDGRVLVTRSGGYQLLIAHGDLDAAQFEDLVAAGRKALAQEDAARAAGHLAKALALWRGPALADVPPGPLVSAVTIAPLLSCTVFALTVIMPPVADAAVPEVAAESAPPSWSLTEFAAILMLPPAPAPCVSVDMPLPAPPTTTDSAGLARPWIVMVPAAPVGMSPGAKKELLLLSWPPALSRTSPVFRTMAPALPA